MMRVNLVYVGFIVEVIALVVNVILVAGALL